MPRLSVLIPTLGREKEPIDTVRALTQQTRLPDEIVVIDQNEPRIRSLDDFLASIPYVKHVRSPKPGVVYNYNLGLRSASHEIVLYLDDDIVPDSRLIEAHLKRYEDPAVKGVAGRVLQPSGDPDPAQIKEFGAYHQWSGKMVAHFNATRTGDVAIAPGGNMSFLRKNLLAIGGFDPGFDGNGYYFETDGSLRYTSAGNRMVFEPNAEMKHLAALRGGARMSDKAEHTYYYVKNGIRLYRRHSPVAGLPFYLAKMAAYTFAKATYNRTPRIALRGFAGILKGLTQDMSVTHG